MAEVCGHIATAPLERDRPLWEMWVIEGVCDTDPCSGGVLAVMTKVHHAAVDGVTGASLLSKLFSVDPDVAPAPVDGGGSAGPLQIAAGGLVRFASRPWQLASVLPATAATSASNSARWSGSLIMRRTARWESRAWGVPGGLVVGVHLALAVAVLDVAVDGLVEGGGGLLDHGAVLADVGDQPFHLQGDGVRLVVGVGEIRGRAVEVVALFQRVEFVL